VSAEKAWGHLRDRSHHRRSSDLKEMAKPFREAMTSVLGPRTEIDRILEELSLRKLLAELADASIPDGARDMGGAGFLEIYYVLVRALRPERVVETGVALGYSSAVILQAMEENGCGALLSVDLPPLSQSADSHVGAVVPGRLRARWSLVIGPDRQRLQRLLPRLGPIDLAFYDSDKSYSGMLRTWELLWRWLRTGGVLVCDDVQTNDAYLTFAERHGVPPLVTAKPSDTEIYRWSDEFLVGFARRKS